MTKKNVALIVVILIVGAIFILPKLSNNITYSTIGYTGQCTLPDCPSSYPTLGDEYCETSSHGGTCYRECNKVTAAHCGTYGSYSAYQSKIFSSAVKDTWYVTPTTQFNSNTCYKYYTSASLSVTDWGTADSVKVYTLAPEKTVCYNSGSSNPLKSDNPITTKGRGEDGAGVASGGKFSTYGSTGCSGLGPLLQVKGLVQVIQYMSTAPWVAETATTTEVECDYCTDTCTSLGKTCGTQTICGASQECGTCGTGQVCTSGKCVTSCTENWQCGAWSACSNNVQTRTCTDLNNCGTTNGKPAISQTCNCIPNCAGRACGLDPVCNTQNCGTCTSPQTCNSAGQCIIGTQTCSQLGGNICSSTDTCSGSWLSASDSARCCSVACTTPQPEEWWNKILFSIGTFDVKTWMALIAGGFLFLLILMKKK